MHRILMSSYYNFGLPFQAFSNNIYCFFNNNNFYNYNKQNNNNLYNLFLNSYNKQNNNNNIDNISANNNQQLIVEQPSKRTTNPNQAKNSSYSKRITNTAKSYEGKVNSSEEGNRLFSPKNYKETQWYKKHHRWGWCCDFAVHCVKNALGDKYPKDMITSSPLGLVKAADEKHNAYLKMPSSDRLSWCKENISPGDIIYMKGSGDSGKHIAIVDSIVNGKIRAISGNSRGGKVACVDYNIDDKIYGFISIDKLVA